MYSTMIGIYWPSRADNLQLCADRAVAHFRVLRELGPGFDRWFHKAMRKPKRPSEADVDTPEEVRDLLQKGVNRRDFDNSMIAELGWSLSLWNGELGNVDAQTNLHCGCASEMVGNSAIIEVSREFEPGLTDRAAVELLKGLVDLWDAETGKVVQSSWIEERQTHEVAEVATYQRCRWPILLPKNAMRHGKGIVKVF